MPTALTQYWVPKELDANLSFRRELLKKSATSESWRRRIDRCASEDCAWFMDALLWQENPKAIGVGSLKEGPWITHDDQAVVRGDLIRSIDHAKDHLIEKARDRGASWLVLSIFLHYWLFRDRMTFIALSRSEDAVDRRGDPSSMFAKWDYALDRLPSWLLDRRAGSGFRQKMGFVNQRNGSSMWGQASTKKAGVGGRCDAMLVDEAAQIDEMEAIWGRTSDTAGCRIVVSTHVGVGGMFWKLCQNNIVPKSRLHWTGHPDKVRGLYKSMGQGNYEIIDKAYDFRDFEFNGSGHPSGGPFVGLRSPWYDGEVLRKPTLRQVAEDLDINPSGSAAQFFDPLAVSRLKQSYCSEPEFEGDVVHTDGYLDSLVGRFGGALKLWMRRQSNGAPPPSTYGIGADVAVGGGGDQGTPSCLGFLDLETGEQVGEYANGNIEPIPFAKAAAALGRWLSGRSGTPAPILFEVGGPGQAFLNGLLEVEYEHLWRPRRVTELREEQPEPGYRMVGDGKRVLLESFRDAVEGRKITVRSGDCLDECLCFARQPGGGGKIEHTGSLGRRDPTGAGVNHGDRTIALALAHKIMFDWGLRLRQPEEMHHDERPPGLWGRLWDAGRLRQRASWRVR